MAFDAKLLSFLRRSKRRKDILRLLHDKPMTVVDIVKHTGMYKSHVSRALSELEKYKLVKCLNPSDRAFRYYKITSKGKRLIKE